MESFYKGRKEVFKSYLSFNHNEKATANLICREAEMAYYDKILYNEVKRMEQSTTGRKVLKMLVNMFRDLRVEKPINVIDEDVVSAEWLMALNSEERKILHWMANNYMNYIKE